MSSPVTQINDSTVNFVEGHQYNITHNITNYKNDRDRGLVSPQSINNSPLGRLSAHFTGRDKEVDFLHNALSKVQQGVLSCCAVYGMPGVGKSQLILHYAKISDQGQYSYIFWISATNVEKLNHGLTNVLDLVTHPDRYLQDQNAKLTAALRWLEEPHGDWLLIFDNVDRTTLDFLRSHLPLRNVRGNILFTTRTADIAEVLVTIAGNEHSTLQLHPLERRDSADLLLRDAGINMEMVTPSLLGRAEELVESVGRLPLAVVQAAAYMKQTLTNLEEMCEFYKGNEKIEVIKWENDLTPYQEQSVATTFTKQFDKLKEESVDLSNLFKILSFLDPENIPVTMIAEGAEEWLHPQDPLPSQPEPDSHISVEFLSLVTLICSKVKFRAALRTLQTLSLIEYRSNEQNPSLWIHDLIRFVRQEGAKKEERYRGWLQLSVSLICGAFRHIQDPSLPQQWTNCEKFMPHLRSLGRWWNYDYGMNLELIDANRRIAAYLESRGKYNDAESLCNEVLGAYKMKFGCEHLSTLLSMRNLALASGEKYLGADHSSTLTSANTLANVYLFQGRYEEAEALYKQTLAGRK